MADEDFDLVVVGAGVLGLTTALAARDRCPAWSVAVLDRGLPVSGVSSRSAAVVASYGPSAAHRALVAAALPCFREGLLAPFSRAVPAFVIAARDWLPRIRSRIVSGRLRQAKREEGEALRGAYADLHPGSGEVLLAAPESVFTVDVGALAEAAFLADRRIECHDGAEVAAVRRAGRRYWVELADGAAVAARRVVLATGPWQPPPVAGASGPTGFAVKRVAALHLALGEDGAPAVFWPAADCFLLPERGRSLFSFPRGRWLRNGEDPAEKFGEEDLTEGAVALSGLAPGLVEAIAGGRAHADAYAEGRLPRVEYDAAAPGVVWLWGGSGSGVALAPALASTALAATTRV